MASGYKHPSQRPGSYTPTRGSFKGQTFRSYRAYQTAHAQRKGFKSAAVRLASPRKPSPKTFSSEEAFQKSTAGRATRAYLALHRDPDLTLAQAAKAAGTTPAAIWRYAGPSLERKGSRVVPIREDAIAVPMTVDTVNGSVSGIVEGSRARKLIGAHKAALSAAFTYPSPQHARELATYKGRTIQFVDGRRVELLGDLQEARTLARRGLLSNDGPYPPYMALDVSGMRSAA